MSNNRKVTKAIITAAGFGTRFLPTTKSVPKEMVPILEYPTIHYIVKELVESGIEDIVVVTRRSMPATMEYFETHMEVEDFLKGSGKDEILDKVQFTNNIANFAFINQDSTLPYGSGSPVLSAKQWVGDENFVIVYCDDLVLSDVPATKQLIDVFNNESDSEMVISGQEVSWDDVEKYGILEYDQESTSGQLKALVEKPPKDEAKSNLAYYGRHVCTPKLFDYLDPEQTEEGREFFLSECIHRMAKTEKVLVKAVEGEWLTTGDPLNTLKASIKYALEREEYKDKLLEFIKDLN